MTTIVEQLKSARKCRGMSATELAKRSGVAKSYISSIEHGQYRPRIDTIEKMAEALSMQILLVPRAV